jgi:hypothetical protein
MHTSPPGIVAETSSLLDAPLAASSRPTLLLPEKPSIAVLPFQNMSDDLEQARGTAVCSKNDLDVKEIVNLWAGGSAAVKSMLSRH